LPTFGIGAGQTLEIHREFIMSLTVADGGRGSGDGGHRQVFPTLTATNYTSWSIQVQAIKKEQGWWEVVEPPEGSSVTGAVTEALARKDKKVRAHLFPVPIGRAVDASGEEEDGEGSLGLSEGKICGRGTRQGRAPANFEG
jgi:hypothetical protein